MRHRPSRTARRLVTAMLVISLLAAFGALVVTAIMAGVDALTFDPQSLSGVSLGTAYAVIGWVVASHVADNRIGWVFLVIGLSQTVEAFASAASDLGLIVLPGSMPLADLWSWVSVWAWVPGFVLLVTLSLLWYPDGRPPTPRWRWVEVTAILGMVMAGVPVAIVAWPHRGITLTGDDMSAVGGAADAVMTIQGIALVLCWVGAIASIASIVVRIRRSTGVERLQLKWFIAAAIVEISAIMYISFVPPDPIAALLISLVITPLMPIATGIAILRYRLFEIDRIVSRTIGWLAVSVILGAVFVGGVLLAQAVLEPVTGGSTIGVAASTLVAAALFSPVRSRVQRAVDRRFNRARYDAERTAAAFADGLRDEVDLDALQADLGALIAATLEPASVRVWVREARG